MNFLEIKDEYFENELIDDLFTTLPELHQTVDKDNGYYHIIGVFQSFLVENFQNEDIFLRCLKFLNKSVNKGGYKTEDLIVMEVYDSEIYSNAILVEKMKKSLSGKAHSLFLKYLDFE